MSSPKHPDHLPVSNSVVKNVWSRTSSASYFNGGQKDTFLPGRNGCTPVTDLPNYM